MTYAVVINLDCESNSTDMCQQVWRTIKSCMLEVGFHLDNRVFVIN